MSAFSVVVGLLIFGAAFSQPSQALQSRKQVTKISKQAAQKEAEKAKVESEETNPEKKEGILPTSVPGFRAKEEAAEYQQVCGAFYVTNKDDLKLGTMENRLVCGDGKIDAVGKPWSEIPPNQMAYFLKGFLQTRGYHTPEFVQDEDRLYVKLGPVARLKTLKYLGAPEGFKPPERRLVKNEPLTPALLNDTQSWALGQIKDAGYACAEGDIQADPETGEVAVFFKPGPQKRIRFLEHTGDMGVSDGALNRYNAFRINDVYRDRMVALSRRRTLDDGFLQTLVTTTKCGPAEQVTVVRDVSLGPPRTVRIGVGGSTEQGPLLKAVIRQSRIGENASSAQVQLNVSYLDKLTNFQSLRGYYNWYYLPGENRYSLRPTLEIKHEAVEAYDLQSTTAQILHDWTFDTDEGHYDLRAGPGFISEDQQRSKTDHVIQAGFIEVGGRWTDHDFEWFNTSPRTGEYVDVTGLFALQGLGSNFTAQKLQIQGEKLWGIGHFDPPLFILGTRFNFSTVFAPNDTAVILPNRFLTYLGGDANLRGYSLLSLPRSQIGALSGASASVEGRLHDVLFKIIDIFTFLDVGILGTKANAQFDRPIFWSPGAGLRWESPFGVLRLYVARRFATEQDPAEQEYDKAFRVGVTFGEEF